MEIKELIKEAHENAKKHGFWDFYDNLASGHEETKQALTSQFLMLIVGEVAEAMEGLRQGNKSYYKCDIKLSEIEFNGLKEIANNLDNPLLQWIVENIKYFDPRENFKEELADVAIRLGDLAGGLDIDLQSEITKKMDKNKDRPYKHGKAF